MDMSPAPSIANLYVAIHEIKNILQHVGTFIFFLRRFIDDGFGVWLHDPDPVVDTANWNMFKTTVNSGGLNWTFTDRSNQVDFMDMTIKIVGSKIETDLFEKPLALHLYIPPHSCHPPGVIIGIVMGNVLRIFQLCSREADIENHLCKFFARLLDRGYQSKKMIPLFDRAICNAKTYLSRSDAYRKHLKEIKKAANKRRIFLHLPFHPDNPPARVLQQLWREYVFSPQGELKLNQLTNRQGELVPIDSMVLAYSRAPNIGNKLSNRKICKHSGPKVSSYI